MSMHQYITSAHHVELELLALVERGAKFYAASDDGRHMAPISAEMYREVRCAMELGVATPGLTVIAEFRGERRVHRYGASASAL